ncbi:MAG TPA: alpha/beta hydrolase [Gemmatimonadaceae bacterium]|nr:alpha/beta hydrolase [Gemmatimonadaceae bacterium]
MSHTTGTFQAGGGWAEVRADGQVLRYRRSGSGRSVLLLCVGAACESPWSALVAALDADFRVLVPVLPPAAHLVRGLTAFLDGLGTTRVAVVATGDLCGAALELALQDPDRVARAVLVPDAPADHAGVDATLRATAHDLAVPLSVLPRGTPTDELLVRIGAFLAHSWE